MDHHVRRAITDGLRARSIDVLTAHEDNHHTVPDAVLLDRATMLGRVLFSQDDDLLAEATHRQHVGIAFSGVAYGHQRKVSIGQCISDLEVIALAGTLEDMQNAVIYLPHDFQIGRVNRAGQMEHVPAGSPDRACQRTREVEHRLLLGRW